MKSRRCVRNDNLSMVNSHFTYNLQKYACPNYCIMSNMSLLNDDGWPSLPRIYALFAGTPLMRKEVDRCFCKGLKTKAMRVMKNFANGVYNRGMEPLTLEVILS